MTDPALAAALHLEAVLPALALLAPHDAELRRAAAGPRAFGVTLAARGVPAVRHLAFSGDGAISTTTGHQPGDLRLWFLSPAQFLRAMAGQTAAALPLGGWGALPQVSRFAAAGARLDALLRKPATDPALHAYGTLAVGLAGAATWLRLHSDGPAHRARLGEGIATFACPALPEPLWLDLGRLLSGTGRPPRPPIVEIVFRDLETLRAELEHRLDSLAALGGGELRIRGHLLVAERIGWVLEEVSRILDPRPYRHG